MNTNEVFLFPEELKKCLNLKQEQREETILVFGLYMVAGKASLPYPALSVNREKKAVAVCANGRMASLFKEDRVNHVQRHPTLFKKKERQNPAAVRRG